MSKIGDKLFGNVIFKKRKNYYMSSYFRRYVRGLFSFRKFL